MEVIMYPCPAELSDEDCAIKIKITFKYYKSDPLAVSMVFSGHHTRDTVEWQVGRELLKAGLTDHAGEGDVKVWPLEGGILTAIVLETPDDDAYLTVLTRDLWAFLEKTEKMVPTGSEELLVFDDLSRWLGSLG